MTRIASLALFLLLISVHVSAVNLVGDADNSGILEMADASFVQDYLYGVIGPNQISPLALADGDGDIDLADLMLGAQAANSTLVISGPGSLLSITHPPNPTLADGDPDYPAVFDVASNYPTATLIYGLEIAISMTPGESMLSALPSHVTTAIFTPLNAQPPNELFFINASIQIHNSDNSAIIETATDSMIITVTPIACGNGVLDTGEFCDDGNRFPSDGCEPDCADSVCVAIPCVTPPLESIVGEDSRWPDGFSPNGWSVLNNAVFNGGSAYYSSNTTAVFEGGFATSLSSATYYVWIHAPHLPPPPNTCYNVPHSPTRAPTPTHNPNGGLG